MATANIYDLADTWNAGGTTYTAIKMNVTDTASAAASLLMDLQVGGSSMFKVTKAGVGTFGGNLTVDGFSGITVTNAGVAMHQDGAVNWGGGSVVLRRDADHVLAQRNSTNAQAFRIYNTYTDGSNYERGLVGWSSNEFTISSEAAGTGTARQLTLMATTGGGRITVQANGSINFYGPSVTQRLGITDDVFVQPAVATPANGSTSARLIFGTTSGFGIYYGSGAPTVSAAQGSIYMRSDGSSTTTRLYVNTDGGTTWTNFTSAA